MIFFSKILKIELNKGLESLFKSRDYVTTHKLYFKNQNEIIQSF